MAIILHFLIIMVESSSESSHSASNSTYGERAVLYSFEVDDNGEQLCPRTANPHVGGRGDIYHNYSSLGSILDL